MKLNRYKTPPITPSYLHMPYQSLRHSVLNNACHKKCQNIRQFSRYVTYRLTNCLLKLYILPNIFIPLRLDNDFAFETLCLLATTGDQHVELLCYCHFINVYRTQNCQLLEIWKEEASYFHTNSCFYFCFPVAVLRACCNLTGIPVLP